MDGKKISFGFAKISKKAPLAAGPASNVSLNSKDNSVQMIDCLEGQTIKIIGQTEELPTVLVIPLREQDKTTVPDRLAKLIGIRQEKQLRTQTVQSQPNSVSYHNSEVNGETTENPVQVKTEPPEEDVTQPVAPVMEETLEQRAAREILENLHESNVKKEEQNNFVVPLLPEELPLDGARESTMDDYESVPIDKFGLAMLRGMGWKDDPNKDSKVERTDTNPTPRPKGLGLGADKGLKAKANSVLIPPAEGEVLVMKRGAQVKVLAGKHKDAYGIAQSIDEEASRVIVKFAIGNAQESLNEYMLQLVSKEEYQKYSKVLNAAKYEEYKNRETAIKSTEEEKDRDRSGQSSRDGTRPRKNRSPSPNERRSRDRDRYDRSRDKRDTQEKSKDRSKQRDDRHREHSDRRRSPNGKKAPSRRHDSSSSDNGVSDHNRATSSEDERERRQRKHKKSTSPYIRTSSGTKKKSHKYKQRRERRDDRDSSRDRRDRRRRGSDSESDDKHHKKKTKKSKKPRSRSRSRR